MTQTGIYIYLVTYTEARAETKRHVHSCANVCVIPHVRAVLATLGKSLRCNNAPARAVSARRYICIYASVYMSQQQRLPEKSAARRVFPSTHAPQIQQARSTATGAFGGRGKGKTACNSGWARVATGAYTLLTVSTSIRGEMVQEGECVDSKNTTRG